MDIANAKKRLEKANGGPLNQDQAAFLGAVLEAFPDGMELQPAEANLLVGIAGAASGGGSGEIAAQLFDGEPEKEQAPPSDPPSETGDGDFGGEVTETGTND